MSCRGCWLVGGCAASQRRAVDGYTRPMSGDGGPGGGGSSSKKKKSLEQISLPKLPRL